MEFSKLNVGDNLPETAWFKISQQKINEFAVATGDHQWIHIDKERCAKESPFGTPIAHGFLSASLMPMMFEQVITVDPARNTMLNYGIDSLRFLEPVRVDDEIRYQFKVTDIEEKPTGRLFKVTAQVNIKDRDKPALVGTFLTLLIEK
ncbi:MaoC family dehydratase [Brumicola nitratireducens]|uniref:Acyl dehydratase n=1 Tax=Glaciecola nitratireducens (strain JCM 12485 / KCTC 12276 / FR1064) TaxID=1085623 RepID=G4QGP6_GLANF|nr:MaoC family dehydratase [Glaciecola nitratireducens]AEP29683.1 Acyl dehydratase [Glaciecola nitratireducens FR1064]|tara:strand:- start:376 stop:819 length:444 start_codon:yes stop_codon:yes gene_type:complete